MESYLLIRRRWKAQRRDNASLYDHIWGNGIMVASVPKFREPVCPLCGRTRRDVQFSWFGMALESLSNGYAGGVHGFSSVRSRMSSAVRRPHVPRMAPWPSVLCGECQWSLRNRMSTVLPRAVYLSSSTSSLGHMTGPARPAYWTTPISRNVPRGAVAWVAANHVRASHGL